MTCEGCRHDASNRTHLARRNPRYIPQSDKVAGQGTYSAIAMSDITTKNAELLLETAREANINLPKVGIFFGIESF